jgi:hypothetical protein
MKLYVCYVEYSGSFREGIEMAVEKAYEAV